jgi:PAS domain S-box-containing protein
MGTVMKPHSRVSDSHPARASPGAGTRALVDASVLDALPHAVFRTDSAGRFDYLSDGWTRLSGFALGDSLGREAVSFLHPADRHRFPGQPGTPVGGPGSSGAVPVRLVHADGEPRWMELHASTLRDHGGDDAALAGTFTNITLRVHEERQRMAAQRTLSGLIDDLPGMVYRCRNNRHWTMEFVSQGALGLTGYRPEDLIDNHTRSYASLIHADDSQMVWDGVQLAVDAKQPFDLTYRIVTADGTVKWVWERGKGIISTSGELLGLEGFITDISYERLEHAHGSHATLASQETGLASAALFHDRLRHELARCARQPDHRLAVLQVHIDRLRGALADRGDRARELATRAVADVLRRTLDPWNTVTHLEQDRFAILLASPTDADAARSVADAIQAGLRAPLSAAGQGLFVTASVGIAIGSAGDDAERLLTASRDAMFAARSLGGARTERLEV